MLGAMAKRKNPAAVALGKLGGRKKVAKGFAMMDPERLRAVGAKGGAARREKKKA
jgi:general stress protein YciG